MSRVPHPRTRLLHSAFTAGALVEALVDEELEAHGVPSQLFSLLGWISRVGPVSPTRLSRETGIPSTTLRDNVHKLVARGDVKRVPNAGDRRSYLIELTARGKRLIARGSPALERALERIADHLPRDDRVYTARIEELRSAVQTALSMKDAVEEVPKEGGTTSGP